MDNSIRSSLIFEEIKLYDDSLERNRLEELSDLYAIIKTTESLEVAYSRDCITAEEYTDACNRIISQFKTTESALVSRKLIDNTDSFMKEFQIDGCARAYERLVITGVPATTVHGGVKDDRGHTVIVAETVQAFITTMDALRLGQRAVDEIQPLIADLTSSLVKIPNIPSDFEGLLKLRIWLQKLHDMRASDEIVEQESRQLLFDLDNSYSAFHKFLQG